MASFPFQPPPYACLIAVGLGMVATPLINSIDDIGARIILLPVLIAVTVGAWFLSTLADKDDSQS